MTRHSLAQLHSYDGGRSGAMLSVGDGESWCQAIVSATDGVSSPTNRSVISGGILGTREFSNPLPTVERQPGAPLLNNDGVVQRRRGVSVATIDPRLNLLVSCINPSTQRWDAGFVVLLNVGVPELSNKRTGFVRLDLLGPDAGPFFLRWRWRYSRGEVHTAASGELTPARADNYMSAAARSGILGL